LSFHFTHFVFVVPFVVPSHTSTSLLSPHGSSMRRIPRPFAAASAGLKSWLHANWLLSLPSLLPPSSSPSSSSSLSSQTRAVETRMCGRRRASRTLAVPHKTPCTSKSLHPVLSFLQRTPPTPPLPRPRVSYRHYYGGNAGGKRGCPPGVLPSPPAIFTSPEKPDVTRRCIGFVTPGCQISYMESWNIPACHQLNVF
jgi:hypothetical protein